MLEKIMQELSEHHQNFRNITFFLVSQYIAKKISMYTIN